jgi:hypothetical protein
VVVAIRSVAHLTYIESVLDEVLLRGHELTLLFDAKWSKRVSRDLLDAFVERWPDTRVGDLRKRQGGVARRLVFGARELRSYGAYVRRLGLDSKYTVRWRQYLPAWAKRASRGDHQMRGRLLTLALRWPASDSCFALIERLVPAERAIGDHLAELGADVVLATPANLRFDEEIEYVKAARRWGIPSAILVLTWDNLTTKGLVHVIPSVLLAWNEAHATEAETLHRVPRSRIRIVGSPFFDKWLDRSLAPEPRDAFCQRLGLAPERPVVLYLGSSKHIAPDEGWVVAELERSLRSSKEPALRDATVLVRPHPFNHEAHAAHEGDGIVVWPTSVRLPELPDQQRELVSAVTHAVCAVGLNTSAMIDAVALDRPVLTVLLDRYADTQRSAEHFRHLADSGAIELATSFDDLAVRIAAVAAGKDSTVAARARFVRTFLRPGDPTVSAGHAAADQLEALARLRR